ncbi:DUF6221 family protein [Streptomyces nigra]|uniref:DUF6221 family protein n=1 Tax=Streptomyces nigra TaxID=1827580 RepID=UPI0034522100
MDELVEWLRAQLDEDERIARAASWADDANAWHAEPSPFNARSAGQRWYVEDAMEDGVVSHVDPRASDDEGVARHIAEWDPARVLREINAKRQILDEHRPSDLAVYRPHGCPLCHTWPCPTARWLTTVYADRPGHREEWRP